jgi:hypothetical protein
MAADEARSILSAMKLDRVAMCMTKALFVKGNVSDCDDVMRYDFVTLQTQLLPLSSVGPKFKLLSIAK